jgi:hypothetical protein
MAEAEAEAEAEEVDLQRGSGSGLGSVRAMDWAMELVGSAQARQSRRDFAV